ncbi:hypothetical protein HMPREF0202_02606 [Cetobacterium somerae ATCC BAA-474]|jgi:hypothetical protein|uniref:Uncharacterized protein n=1 Tax=Cetobacterium somerae ATCC BAA-474 TaxID=1319815 RepID=U7V5C3_9FUSO|nr:hypothetical protein HMPREF0202_02606 [Cetobacterium somerae ATCC BAA-474]
MNIVKAIVKVICKRIKAIPETPSCKIVLILKVPPNKTIEYESKSLSENLEPGAKIVDLAKVFPAISPKKIARGAPPMLGTNFPRKTPSCAIKIQSSRPGIIFLAELNILKIKNLLKYIVTLITI